MKKYQIIWKNSGKKKKRTKSGKKNSSFRENCLYLELFWSSFPRIWTEYVESIRISPYSVQMQKNNDQNNSE